MRNDVIDRLKVRSEENYKEFNCKLIPGVDKGMVLGVRVPDIRKEAKALLKEDYWAYLEELELVPKEKLYYEEIMIQGMVIGGAKMSNEERFSYIEKFVPRIDNWAVCDIVCGDLKFAKKKENRDFVWQFLQQYFCDDREFFVRFAVVMALSHYINESYIERVLSMMETVDHEGYYVKMAVAWTLSICYIKFPEQTEPLLHNNKLDGFTHNKAIQKIRESYRVSKEDKDRLNKLKRK